VTVDAALEYVGVVLGVIYVLLILKRNRLGWIAGGLSSAIYVYLAATARLPMQSTLQAYYVVMAVYGWVSWTSSQHQQQGAGIGRWPWRRHLVGWCAILILSAASARLLARETHAAWPYLDSLTTWISLLATWMTARMKLENWLYWIAADAITAFLFAAQGYLKSTALFLAYMVIAVFGFREWLLKYRQQIA
jgi:nicotinamide mononucleotide transporter